MSQILCFSYKKSLKYISSHFRVISNKSLMIFLILRVVRCLLVLVWPITLPKIWPKIIFGIYFHHLNIPAWDVLKKKSCIVCSGYQQCALKFPHFPSLVFLIFIPRGMLKTCKNLPKLRF